MSSQVRSDRDEKALSIAKEALKKIAALGGEEEAERESHPDAEDKENEATTSKQLKSPEGAKKGSKLVLGSEKPNKAPPFKPAATKPTHVTSPLSSSYLRPRLQKAPSMATR